jgi:hypothetical protein
MFKLLSIISVFFVLTSCSNNSHLGPLTPLDNSIEIDNTPYAKVTAEAPLNVTRELILTGQCINVKKVYVTSPGLEGQTPKEVRCIENKYQIKLRYQLDFYGPQTISFYAQNEINKDSGSVEVQVLFDVPREIAGLELWLDGKDPNTFFSDKFCEDPITNTKKTLKCWKDKSGVTHHVTQSNASQAPVINNSGRPYFNGNNALIDSDGGGYINGSRELEFFAVVKADEIGTNQAFWDTEARDFHDDLPSLRFDQEGVKSGCKNCLKVGVKTDSGEGQTESASNLQKDQNAIYHISWESGDFVRIYDEGILAVSSYAKAVSGTIVDSTRVMIGDGSKEAWKGEILEILYFKNVLSDYERKSVVNYLKKKWR